MLAALAVLHKALNGLRRDADLLADPLCRSPQRHGVALRFRGGGAEPQ
jgi:hypothetical protein